MPLKRYAIKNEYSLADPDLYKLADKDDPEALLESVAMASLVGVLRQLGDLAEFAAEIFHDLHEEVMSTAARGHGLIVRVQEVEAELPSIERKLLSQTNHTSFLYKRSVDWHANLRLDQNTVAQGDLPRFVMDSYEECRGPPRLFLLDKFDVAGAGACLKRFTDPSFFKMEYSSCIVRQPESQWEKKTRKTKKRGLRWRNAETHESFPSSHAKLHQLFLEERIEGGGNDPDRHVKLKKRQFTGSLFDQENTKSYMETFLDTCAPEPKIVHEMIDPLPLTWTSHNPSESSPEIVEIGTVSPKELIEHGPRLFSSSDMENFVEKPTTDKFCGQNSNFSVDSEAVEIRGVNSSNYDGNIVSAIDQVENGDSHVDEERKSELSMNNGCGSDEIASESNYYVDALATIESEVETDYECMKYPPYLSLKPVTVDSDGSLEHSEPRGRYTNSQSLSNSTVSEDDNMFGEGKNSLSNNSFDSSKSDIENTLSDCHFASEAIKGSETKKHRTVHMANFIASGGPRAEQEIGDISDSSCLPNTRVSSVDMDGHLTETLRKDEVCSKSTENNITSGEKVQGHAFVSTGLANEIVSDFPENTENRNLSREYSIHGETEHVSGVYSDALADARNTAESLQKESHNAHVVCSPLEEHTKDTGGADLDTFSDNALSLEQPSISGTECHDKITNSVTVEFTLSVEGNTKDHFPALGSENSFNIPEKHSESIYSTPSPDGTATLCSEEDPSYGVALDPIYHGQRLSSSDTAVQVDKSLTIRNELNDAALEVSTSGNTEPTEIVECSSFEGTVDGIDSSAKMIHKEIFSRYPDGKIMGDSLMVGKLSPSLDFLKSEDEFQERYLEVNDYGHGTVLKADSVSIGKVGRKAITNILGSNGTSLDFITSSPDQTEPAEMMAHLDCHKVAVDVESSDDKIEDENNIVYNDTSLSDVPHKHTKEPGSITEAENDADLAAVMENLEPVDTVAKCYDGLLSTVHPDMFQDQHISSEACIRNGGELTDSKHMNPVLDGFVDSSHNLWVYTTDDSPSIFLQEIKNMGKLIVDAPLVSENCVQYVGSSSSKQIHLSEDNYDHVDSSRHGLINSSALPGKVDTASTIMSLYEPGVSPSPDNLDEHIQTPEYVQSNSITDMIIGANYALSPERQLVYPPDFPVLSSPLSDHPLNLEAPPLPPLPPMQWRLGRSQNTSLPPERQLVHQRADQVQVQSMSLPGICHSLGPAESMPMVHAISEGFPQYGMSMVGRQGNQIFSVPTTNYMGIQGGFTMATFTTVSEGSSHDNLFFFAPSTSTVPQSGTHNFENLRQPNVIYPKLDSSNGDPSNHDHGVMDAAENVGFVASQAERTWLSAYDIIPTHAGDSTNGVLQKKLPRPRNPLIDEVVAIDKSKMRKVERVKPALESKTEEGGYVLEHFQLRKVGELVRPPVEPKTEAREFLSEPLQLKKVGERYKSEAELKAEETGSTRVHLRKGTERVKHEIEARNEESGSPRVRLRKVGERVKQVIEARNEETGSPLVQLRKVGERLKQEFEATTEETVSLQMQLRKVGEMTHSVIEPKAEERDSLFEQIRNKSFSLKPAVAARPNIQGPRTNLKVAAILEKASNIRQAMVGSDEDDDADAWG